MSAVSLAGEPFRAAGDVSVMSKAILSILGYTRGDGGNPSRLRV